MKYWYVYEIYDSFGTVLYVGESIRPKKRLYEHKQRPTGRGKGLFYGKEVFMHIVNQFDNRKDAKDLEVALQNEYGFINDRKKRSIPMKGKTPKNIKTFINKGGHKSSSIIRTCNNCGKQIKGPVYFQHIKSCL